MRERKLNIRIMGPFDRLKCMLSVALSILSFPGVALWLHRIGDGYRRWSRRWWRNLYRVGGWILLRRWTAASEEDRFVRKLAEAKRFCLCRDLKHATADVALRTR